jgi:O-methyltransferase
LSYKYINCYDDVINTFSDTPNCVIIKGTVPDTLEEVKTKHVAFLSIDMNCAAPEIAAAEYFWPKLSTGAVMLLDDYGVNPTFEPPRAK